ncbi:MAG: hypothetical protein JOZ43_00805 [Acidobacteriales bacterium]|nr:hypothetical protein [Terriglobales bacterium]
MTLENSNIRVIIDKGTGCITSLFDKHSSFEAIAPNSCGNQLVAFADNPKDYDAWNIDADFESHPTPLSEVDSVQLVENTPFRSVIRVTRHWQKSRFTQDLILYSGADQVDIDNEIDWHETHVLLKAAFPLNVRSDHATYEIPYGTIERPTTRNNSFEKAKFEVPALRWADLSDAQHGVTLINESKYGYDAKDNVLRLSLLRSPTWPDPDADRGLHRFSYAVYPHGGDWKQALSIRHGYEYNYGLSAQQVESHAGVMPARASLLQVSGDDVVVTAVKKAEDSPAIVIRMFEWAGTDSDIHLQTSLLSPARAKSLDLMEKEAESEAVPVTPDVSFHIRPFEIKTISLETDKAR